MTPQAVSSPRLRQTVEALAGCVYQVTPRHLVSGFYRGYSLCVAMAMCIVCTSLACGAFASVTALLAWSTVALMSSTLLYRLLGGAFATDARRVADWLYDVGVKSNVCDVADALASPHARTRCVAVVLALSLAVELAAWWSPSVLLTAASLLWVAYLLTQPYTCRSC